MMNILVFNCGSSSLKYRVIAMPSEVQRAGGEAQRVGPPTAEPSRIVYHIGDVNGTHYVEMPDQATAFEQVMALLAKHPELRPDVVAHRMVHGGTRFQRYALVDEKVIADLDAVADLAPLHNPPATALVKACRARYPDLPQVVVFDTAYHSTIPDYARTYAIPRWMTTDKGIRKYGFHGTSHQYVATEAAKFLGRPMSEFNAVSCHLGSGGASLCAIVKGRSVDNTMGYSPLQGLIMSTRCGDLDPALTLRLLAHYNGDFKSVERVLNKESGVLGMSGVSADISDILAGIAQGKGRLPKMDLTAQIYLWRIRKYLGAYMAAVGYADAVIFTDTIGEKVAPVRWAVCADMETFGLSIDPERNRNASELPVDVATDSSPVRILVVQTNEELAIAREAYSLLSRAGSFSEHALA